MLSVGSITSHLIPCNIPLHKNQHLTSNQKWKSVANRARVTACPAASQHSIPLWNVPALTGTNAQLIRIRTSLPSSSTPITSYLGRKVQSLEKCSQNCMAEAQLAGQWGRGLIPCMKCTSPLAGPISKVCPAAGTRPLVDTTVQHKRHWAEKNLINKICSWGYQSYARKRTLRDNLNHDLPINL